MFKNFFKLTWRNIAKSKTFSFINIFGLSAGLTCCMLIGLYLDYENNYDSYHRHIHDLYQIGTVFIKPGEKDEIIARTSAPVAAAMKNDFPEILETVRIVGLFTDDKTLFQYNAPSGNIKSLFESQGYLADPAFFRMFTYQFREGDPATALNNPNSLVISEDIAKKIFGDQPALGKVVHINSNLNGEYDFTITGVFRPIDKPTHIDARFVMSLAGGAMEQYIKNHATDFASNNMFYSYLLLRPGSDPHKLESKFPAFMEKYAAKDLKAMGRDKKQFLIPVEEIHLHKDISSNVTPAGSRTYLRILASIAVFTLLIACINFMNLSTARSSKRSMEVGIRKVLGARKNSIILQFLGESLIMAFISVAIASAFTRLLLPYFNQVSGKNIQFSLVENGWMLLIFSVFAIITGIIAGSYPAFYLSSFKPAKVLKGKFSNSLSAVSFRKGLVIFQFIISVILIIASVVISGQMHYLRNADLGFEKDQQLIIPMRSQEAKNIYSSLKNEIRKNTQVTSVGASLYYPGIFNPSDNLFYKKGQTMNDAKDTRVNIIDYDFLKTLQIKPVAGRMFSEAFPGDSSRAVILNETSVKELGFTSAQQAVGQEIYFDFHSTNYHFDVIGVVKDFHFEDLHQQITPFSFGLGFNGFNFLIVHAKPGNLSSLLNSISGSWHKLNPSEPFEYSFLDKDFQKNYEAYDRLAVIITYFTVIAILISCLGLFGLATFSIEQRVKEIGVRKVLGASVSSIVSLVSADFLKLVFVALVIASPIAWYIMQKWLNDFAYRTSISWTTFATTTFIALGIAIITISFQAIKAALTNPVKSLRSE